ncbi:MAG: alpha/beta hydrolase [Pseudohongiellaceae bacterium]
MRITTFLLALLLATPALAQLTPSAEWAAEVETRYQVSIDVTYMSQAGADLAMDVYSRRDVTTPQPTLVFFHGGFWVAGNKNTQIMNLMPWLEMGWNVVNVGYRLGRTSPAPAAVIDGFCALRFLNKEAARFNIDTQKIVVSGQSAGGHLAMAMAMIPHSQGFSSGCPAGEDPSVAAVINWFGVTDVQDVISGTNRNENAATWFGGVTEPLALAQRLSPMTYVRNDLPPILSIHGDADTVVPYAHGVNLHRTLATTNVRNQLVTIPGGGHGRFTPEQRNMIYTTIQEFLMEAGL